MAALTLRVLTRPGDTTKSSPLSNIEIDQNFINLDADLDLKAPIASPEFTGAPLAPTATVGTNTTQIATTAYVIAERGATATLTNKTVPDTSFWIADDADATKRIRFEVSGVTTATTRLLSVPNADGTLATTANFAQTFAGSTTFSNTFTVSSTTVTLGSSTAASTINIGSGASVSGATKAVNIGTGGAAGSTTAVVFGPTAGAVSYTFNGLSAIKMPAGASADRPTGAAGMFRFNTESNQFEGYNGTAWGSVGGGGATGGSASNPMFWENDTNVTASYTITAGKNAGTFGPVTVNPGVVVTVPDGSNWTVV